MCFLLHRFRVFLTMCKLYYTSIVGKSLGINFSTFSENKEYFRFEIDFLIYKNKGNLTCLSSGPRNRRILLLRVLLHTHEWEEANYPELYLDSKERKQYETMGDRCQSILQHYSIPHLVTLATVILFFKQ